MADILVNRKILTGNRKGHILQETYPMYKEKGIDFLKSMKTFFEEGEIINGNLYVYYENEIQVYYITDPLY